MGEHVERTTKLLDAMTDRHCHMEQSVNKVTASHAELCRRLEMLERKFATASFSGGSTRTSEGGTSEALPRPAIVVGGWDAEQSSEETLQAVKQHLSDLRCDLDLDDAFVPGLRRGFAIVPIEARAGKATKLFKQSVQVTGQTPQGGERYMWAAMSESPERRRRTKIASAVMMAPADADTLPLWAGYPCKWDELKLL
ncbi:ANK3, partial [Symbiodinium sp. CCMP2456]